MGLPHKAASALVSAADILRYMGFENVLYHRSREPFSGKIDPKRGGGQFGPGFYTAMDDHHADQYGDHLKRLDLPIEFFQGNKALLVGEGAKVTYPEIKDADISVVLNPYNEKIERYVVFHPKIGAALNKAARITDLGVKP